MNIEIESVAAEYLRDEIQLLTSLQFENLCLYTYRTVMCGPKVLYQLSPWATPTLCAVVNSALRIVWT